MLIITGTLAHDYIMDFAGVFSDHILPDQLHKINISFTAENFEKRFGGTAGNVVYNLGLLQTKHKLLSVVGKDAGEYQKRLNDLGIDLSHLTIDESSYTDSGFAMTDKKDNQIWSYFYVASKKIPQLKLESVAKKGDFVLLGPCGKEGTLALLSQCKNLGLEYLFDPGFLIADLTDDELCDGILYASYIVGNDYEVTLLKKRISNWNNIVAEKVVITTLGEQGSKIDASGKFYIISAAKPTKVSDPTGAGDAWRAGFLTGLDKSLDLPTSGELASVVASFAVEEYGAQEHTFTLPELEERYRQTYKKPLHW